MDITTLAAWGEFIGGIAVVVSLVYLASQIRQNSKLLRVATTGAVAESDIEFAKLFVDEPELARILADGLADRESLPTTDRRRFDSLLDMIIRVFKRDYYFALDGAINESMWQGERQQYVLTLQQPGARQWWTESAAQNWYGDEFRDYISDLVREGEAAS